MEKKNRNGWKEFRRFIKYALFAASAGLVETGVFYLLGLIPSFGYWACYLPALIASVIWNFVLNRRFTFKSAVNIPVAIAKVFAYYLVFTPLSTILGDWLVEVRFEGSIVANNVVFFVTLLINFITEFVYQRYFVFKNQIDNREKAKEKA